MKYLAILLALFLLAGCSVAGPFVTSISSDGKGGLIVQKGYAEFNYFLGVLGNKEASESKVQLIPDTK